LVLTATPLTLDTLNSVSEDDFVALLDDVYEQCPWVAQRAAAHRPFATLAGLKHTLASMVQGAEQELKLALIRAYPEILDQAMVTGSGMDEPSLQQFHELNEKYKTRFGFPFVLAVCGPRGTGLAPSEILSTLERRLTNTPDFEVGEALRNIHRLAETRLNDKFGVQPSQGNLVWDWCEDLAKHSEPEFAQRGELTVTYLTDAHRACAKQIADVMRNECGFDEVTIDAVGNVVGVYHGQDRSAQRLLTGSHYDTVRNGGKYDGRLGIFVPMACVRALASQGKRLPFGIEVIGFSEEEGQRYKAVFLGSGALTGEFDMQWLEQRDAAGISMREAMQNAGLNVDDIAAIKRDAAHYLGFVEVHVEQGPVLNELDLPLGVVTSINGSVRFVGEVAGMASHAGTTPMGMRRDAATAVSELALYLEQRAASVPDLVGTMGMLEVPSGSVNVVPGRCRFSLDIRATTNEVRDACVADVKSQLQAICERRGLQFSLEEIMRAAAAPSAPEWQTIWEQSVQALGLPVYRMPSGAGHDAMKLHNIMPQAMLFVRGLNSGISHNPLEMTTSDDADLAVQAFSGLLDQVTEQYRSGNRQS
jgi:N-carbamoyl-L-amino-acid hydrolase